MLQEVVVNVVANIIAAVILAVIGVSTFVVYFILNRQKLLRFFGINHRYPNLSIFVSRLEIKENGTTGFEPITKGFYGPGIIRVEYKGALLVRDLLRSRFLARLPKGFEGWLRRRYVVLADIDPAIDVSPQTLDEIPSDNLILLGSGVYNIASKHYFEHPSSYFTFTKNQFGERAFKIRTGGMKDVEIPGRSLNRELAIIQRINDLNTGRTVFICAGLGASATYGSVRYLVENWRDLQREFKGQEFGICLAFPNQPRDSDVVVTPKRVYPEN